MNKHKNRFEARYSGLCWVLALAQRSRMAISEASVRLSVCGVLDKIAHQHCAAQLASSAGIRLQDVPVFEDAPTDNTNYRRRISFMRIGFISWPIPSQGQQPDR